MKIHFSLFTIALPIKNLLPHTLPKRLVKLEDFCQTGVFKPSCFKKSSVLPKMLCVLKILFLLWKLSIRRHCFTGIGIVKSHLEKKSFRSPQTFPLWTKFGEQIANYILGPVTPFPIFIFSLPQNPLAIWMTFLKSESKILVPIRHNVGPKLDQFWNLNFPTLFSDWSIQKFRKNIL